MATGARHSVYFVAESVSGTTPATPALTVFRATGNKLDVSIKTLESAEIRNDRETTDFRLGVRHVAGAVSGELSLSTFDELIAAALCGAWTNDAVQGGVLRKSFTFIDEQADLVTGKYTIYRGCEINKMSLKVKAEGVTEIEFDIVGRKHEVADTLPTGATLIDRTTSSPMDGFSGSLKEGGAAVAVITELDLTVDNIIEPRFVVGSKESIAPSIKRRKITGSINTYFEDNTLRAKYLNEVESSLQFELLDPATPTHKYTIDIPRVKYTKGTRDVSGENDIMLKLDWTGLYDAVDAYSIKVTRVVS